MDSLPEDAGAGPTVVLSRFRREFRACLAARADELTELADAVPAPIAAYSAPAGSAMTAWPLRKVTANPAAHAP